MPHPPDALGERLRALPDFDPPATGWTRLSAALQRPRRRRGLPTALAAGLAMLGLLLLMRAGLLPERGVGERQSPPAPVAAVPPPGDADLALLFAAHGDDRELLFAALHRLAPADEAVEATPGPLLPGQAIATDHPMEEEWI